MNQARWEQIEALVRGAREVPLSGRAAFLDEACRGDSALRNEVEKLLEQETQTAATQTIAVERELGIDREKLNVSGGAIAIGHPLAASGSRIITHLLHELKRRGKRYGLGTACIGGGQGIAIIVESFG